MSKSVDVTYGGSVDYIPVAYHLIPPKGLARIAAVLRQGEESGREDEDWRKVLVREQVNHAINHLLKYLEGDTSEDHMANAGCRVLMALDLSHSRNPSDEDPYP